jgi:hypothetical protein
MNLHQRRVIAIAGITIVVMLLYPPFQIMGRGLGYSWLFTPPYEQAIINVGQLLVQWVAVVLIASAAFILVKDIPDSYRFDSIRSIASVIGITIDRKAPPNRAIELPATRELIRRIEDNPTVRQAVKTALDSMTPLGHPHGADDESATPAAQANPLYEAVIGERGKDHYLRRFREIDRSEGKAPFGINWGAFFGGGVWALYRKMYGWFFIFWAASFLTTLIQRKASGALGAVAFGVFWTWFAINADILYHRHVRNKIASASGINHPAELLKHLRIKGGVHIWVLWLAIALPILGMLAAIIIPIASRA